MAKVARRISLRGRDSANIDEDLVNEAGKVYTEFASQLRKLDSTRNEHFENNEKCYFAERIVQKELRTWKVHCGRMSFNREDLLLMTSFRLKATIYDTIFTEKPYVGVLASNYLLITGMC
jgi:hypothetical protein